MSFSAALVLANACWSAWWASPDRAGTQTLTAAATRGGQVPYRAAGQPAGVTSANLSAPILGTMQLVTAVGQASTCSGAAESSRRPAPRSAEPRGAWSRCRRRHPSGSRRADGQAFLGPFAGGEAALLALSALSGGGDERITLKAQPVPLRYTRPCTNALPPPYGVAKFWSNGNSDHGAVWRAFGDPPRSGVYRPGLGFHRWAVRDLNPRPLACHASALPTAPTARGARRSAPDSATLTAGSATRAHASTPHRPLSVPDPGRRPSTALPRTRRGLTARWLPIH